MRAERSRSGAAIGAWAAVTERGRQGARLLEQNSETQRVPESRRNLAPATALRGGAGGLDRRRIRAAKLVGQASRGDGFPSATIRPGEQRSPRAGQAQPRGGTTVSRARVHHASARPHRSPAGVARGRFGAKVDGRERQPRRFRPVARTQPALELGRALLSALVARRRAARPVCSRLDGNHAAGWRQRSRYAGLLATRAPSSSGWPRLRQWQTKPAAPLCLDVRSPQKMPAAQTRRRQTASVNQITHRARGEPQAVSGPGNRDVAGQLNVNGLFHTYIIQHL
jgi:hypothetical protein